MLAALILFGISAGCQETEKAGFSSSTSVGTSSEPRETKDSWDLQIGSGVDIIFFGDTSSSMTEELQTLGSEVTEFVDGLVSFTDDWQLIAVTGPDGCGVGGVLNPTQSNYSQIFSDGIITPPGEDLVDEWGIFNVVQALEESTQGGCNNGFLRENARLHIIFISDEEDNSPGWDSDNNNYWKEYYSTIAAKKSSPEQIMFSGIIGPQPDGCYGVEPGNGYTELIAETKGENLSICDEWQNDIDRLVDATVSYPLFSLSEVPIEASIEVQIDDQPQEGNWTYEAERNSVYFGENAPKLGNRVQIVYTYYP